MEGYSFEKEGFFSFNPNPKTNNDIKNNIQSLQAQSQQVNNSDMAITSKYTDLSTNIYAYSSLRTTMGMDDISNNSKYNEVYIPDSTDTIKNVTDVRKQDINTILLQQNYIYIIGSVTCATLLVAAIMIGRSRE
jgi:hypothetical protein